MVFLVNFGRVAFAPLLETFRAVFGVGPAAVGLITTLVWVGTALPRIPVGVLLTRVPRRQVVGGAGLLLAVGAALAAVAPTLAVLQAAALLIGLASGAYFVAAIPLVGELYPERVGRALGLHGTAAQVAAVLAPAAIVVLVRWASWRVAFGLLGVGALAATLAFVVLARAADGEVVVADPDRDFLSALRHWRVLLVGVGLVAAAGFVWQGLFNFYVSYLLDKGLSVGSANALLSVAFGAGVPAFALSGRLADRLPLVPYLLALSAGFVVVVFGITTTAALVPLAVLSAALGYAVHSLFPAVDAFVLGRLPDGDRASAYAVFSGSALVLEAGGSGVVGLLTEAGVPFDTTFRALAVFPAVVCAILALLYAVGRIR